jgi:hypothetical protein
LLNGSFSNSVDTATSPSINATSSYINTSAIILAIKAEDHGVISEGLIITVLPDAIADTNGPNVRLKGKFHGEIIKQTPLGSYI